MFPRTLITTFTLCHDVLLLDTTKYQVSEPHNFSGEFVEFGMLPDTKTPMLKLAPEKDLDQGQTFLRIEQWSYERRYAKPGNSVSRIAQAQALSMSALGPKKRTFVGIMDEAQRFTVPCFSCLGPFAGAAFPPQHSGGPA
jgi:hypothetical protein